MLKNVRTLGLRSPCQLHGRVVCCDGAPAEARTSLGVQAEVAASARMAAICNWAAHGELPAAAPDDAGNDHPCAELPLLLTGPSLAPAESPTLGARSPQDTIPAYRPDSSDGCQQAEAWDAVPAEGYTAAMLEPCVREQLVRSLLSRNAEVLQRLQEV